MNSINLTPIQFKRSRTATAVLILATGLMSFGCLVELNVISAVSATLVNDGSSQEKVATFQSLVCLASALSLCVVGYFSRRLSWPTIGIVCSFILFIASLILAYTNPGDFWFSASRFIFGIGFAIIFVVQDSVLAKSIGSASITVAFTVVLVMDRLAEFLTFNIGSYVAHTYGVAVAFWLASGVAGLAVLASLIVYMIADRSQSAKPHLKLSALVHQQDRKFWWLTTATTAIYSAYFSFIVLGTDLLKENYGLSTTMGNFLNDPLGFPSSLLKSAPGVLTIIHLLALFLSFPVATIIRRKGIRVEIMLTGSVLLALAFLILLDPSWHPVLPLVILGVGFVLVTVPLWPAVPLLSSDDSAYVLVSVPQYIGMAVFAWLQGWLRTTTGSYESGLFVSVVLSGFAALSLIALRKLDRQAGNKLGQP